MKGEIRSGYTRAYAFANKMRRAAFAAFGKKVPSNEIVRAAAELNQWLFHHLVKHNVQKNYVVRIVAPYEIKDGKINWKYDDIIIEVFMPTVVIEGDETRLVEAVESERFEPTYEEYEAAHGDE